MHRRRCLPTERLQAGRRLRRPDPERETQVSHDETLRTEAATADEAIARLDAVVAGIGDGDLHLATPAGGWTAAQYLSHANLAANAEAVSQALPVTDRDRLLASLPLFHAFGTFSLWFCLRQEIALICQPNPLDAKRPGEMDRAIARRLLTHPDAERLVGGLLGAFFGAAGDDVDEQAAAARRSRPPAPVADAPSPSSHRHSPGGASSRSDNGASPACRPSSSGGCQMSGKRSLAG